MSISAVLSVARQYKNGGAVNTDPSFAQKMAGNYKMRHITFQGIPITIENPKGSIREGINSNGRMWSNRMTADYGYIKRTEGKDGDQVDAFVGPNKKSDRVFIIDQLHHQHRKFDEHKCLLGYNTEKQALTAYHASYGRKYGAHHTVGAVTELSIDAFKEWLKGGGGKEPIAPGVPKFQEGGAVEDVPGVGPMPTTMPDIPEPAAIKAYRETPSWMEQATQEAQKSAEAYQRAGAGAMFADTSSAQELAGGFGGTTIGKAGAFAKATPKAIGKVLFDLHPEEVASALQTSGTKGTSAGGIFSGFSDGKDRYVKIAKSLDHAKEEVLASKLYELAGVRAAKTELTELNGKPAIASQIIPNTTQLSEFEPHQYAGISGLKEDFPAHAWLANWDAPGVGSENPLGNIMVDGQWNAHYVDFGGALRYRGLGGTKGDLFGPKVTETKLMLGQTAKNPLVASVFEGHQIGPDNPVAQRIANITNDQINDLVNIYGPSDPKENFALKAKLVNRRNDLAKQYGIEPVDESKRQFLKGMGATAASAAIPGKLSAVKAFAPGDTIPLSTAFSFLKSQIQNPRFDETKFLNMLWHPQKGGLSHVGIGPEELKASGVVPKDAVSKALISYTNPELMEKFLPQAYKQELEAAAAENKANLEAWAADKAAKAKGPIPKQDLEQLQAEWEAKLAESPPEYAPQYSELSGYKKPSKTVEEEYTFKNPEEDAARVIEKYTIGFDPVEGDYKYDVESIAHDLYKMAEKNPEYVDLVTKKLIPFGIHDPVQEKLSQIVQRQGDPWSAPDKLNIKEEAKQQYNDGLITDYEYKLKTGSWPEDKKLAPTVGGGKGIGGTIKLMNLNKTHSIDQLVNSVKDYHKSELNVGKTITAKQKDKIASMMSDAPSQKIANAIKNLDADDQKNILSWLPAAKASNVKTLAKIDPGKAAQPIPEIDKIQKSHSLYQVISAIKNYSPQYAEVPYHATHTIPKELSKFSPHEIIKEMEPLSLAQKEKVISWLPQSTKEKMAQIGAEKAVKRQGFIGQEYYDALEPINWSQYKPKKAQSVKHQFSKTMLQHILGLGFNPDVTLYKGGKHLTYPQTILDPVTEPHRLSNPEERAFFLSHDPEIAKVYGVGAAQAPMEYIARPGKVFSVDWKEATGTEDYSSHHMKRFIEAAREKGADLLIVKEVGDIGGYGHGLQTQYAFLNTHVLRGPSAKFDVDKLHMRWPLAGIVGGGLFSYGTLKGQQDEGKMASGGRVKSTKDESNYRLGTKDEHCAICTMFRKPDSCTAVEGKIRPQDTCDFFDKIKGMATGGKIRSYTMPLKKGSSKATISQNIREFHTGPTFAHTAAKFGKERARKQAIAVALSTARKSGKKKALGGPNVGMESMVIHGGMYGLRHEGMIHSSIPGRTDKLPMNVRSGSYVLPADIPSALGQGNTMAGGDILKKMFSSGPYGMAAPRGGAKAPRPMSMRMPRMKADGGQTDDDASHVPIIAAGGEYIIHPEVVRDIGHGDIKAGHKVLDRFVLNVRKKNIETLKKLPGPKK